MFAARIPVWALTASFAAGDVLAQDSYRPLPGALKIGLPKADQAGRITSMLSLPEVMIAPTPVAKMSAAFKTAGEALVPGGPPPIINAGATFSLSPAQPRVAARGALGVWGARWVYNGPESAYGSAHFSGTQALGEQYAEVRVAGLVNRLLVVDCLVMNNDGPSKADDAGQYNFRVYSLPASGSGATQHLAGQVAADAGHVFFAFRPNAERTFLNFNRSQGEWSLTRCDVLSAQ